VEPDDERDGSEDLDAELQETDCGLAVVAGRDVGIGHVTAALETVEQTPLQDVEDDRNHVDEDDESERSSRPSCPPRESWIADPAAG
jgi:hypothetical protein